MTKREVIEQLLVWYATALEGSLHTPYNEGSSKARRYQMACADMLQDVLDLLSEMRGDE